MSILLRWSAGFWDTAKLDPGPLASSNKVAVSLENTDGGTWELRGETSE